MKKTLFILLLSPLIYFNQIKAQEIPKDELRATWLTTVWGLDWPSSKISQTGNMSQINQQKGDLITILDSVKKAGLNAAFFQVRPECDAFYQSSYEPWSAHLVSSRGLDPGYDPLAFAIEEAHKRGIELHAWINPYRFESSANKYAGQEGDFRQSHPNWVLEYDGGGSILDPGNPEVRQHIVNVISEIVENYNIDGIIFDDYFYAYGGTPYSLDSYSQSNWKPANKDLHDWRRENVNKMVADVNNAIKGIKPWVRFGLSPFGIWTTDASVAASYGLTLPKGISGLDAYKSIYCDPVAWLEEKTVDYISPQIYWSTNSSKQNYSVLSNWWSNVVFKYDRHLFVSHSLSNLDESDYTKSSNIIFNENFDFSKLNGLSLIEYSAKKELEKSTQGYDPSEYGKQITDNRTYDKMDAPGSVFFRTINIFKRGFINYLLTHEYKYKALPPAFNWYGYDNQGIVSNIEIIGDSLHWNYNQNNQKYTIYAIPNDKISDTGNFKDGKYLIGTSYKSSFNLQDYSQLIPDHTFAVAVLDKYGNEFAPATLGATTVQNEGCNLITPKNNKHIFSNFVMDWSDVNNAELYILEIATDNSFNSIILRKELYESSYDLSSTNLQVDEAYYWRVFTRKVNAEDKSSNIEKFTLKSFPKPTILYPTNGLDDVDVTPTISWQNYEAGDYFYKMQISKDKNFTSLEFEKDSLESNEYSLGPGSILTYSTYYIRILSYNDTITTDWSNSVLFSTVTTKPSVPTIVTPTENQQVSTKDISIAVKQDKFAKGFTFQWSTSANFPWNNRKQETIDSPDTTLILNELEAGTWYVRARANYSNSKSTDWSNEVMFQNLYTNAAYLEKSNFEVSAWLSNHRNSLNVSYHLPYSANTTIILTDVSGRILKQFKRENISSGTYTNKFSINSLPQGIYILTLKNSYFQKSIKIIK